MTVIGDGKTAISTSVNVTLQSTSNTALIFQSYGLHGPGVDPGPASLTGAATVTLKANDYVTVPIAVTGLSKLGTYQGSVEFRKSADPPGKGAQVPITVLVRGTVVIPQPALTAFHCFFDLSCAVGNYIAPLNQGILVNNQDGQVSAQPNYVRIFLHVSTGDSTLNLTERQLTPDLSQPIAAGDARVFKVSIPSPSVIAGHYDGFLRAGLQTGETISSPVTLDVRDAPLIAILLLFLGIVFGRIVQSVSSPSAQAQQRLTTNLASLRSAAAFVNNSDVTLLLEKKMADARQAIATMITGEQAITQQLQDIGTAITIESNLEWIEANLNRIPAANQATVQANVIVSRTDLLKDDLPNADNARKQAQGDLLTHLDAAGLLPGKMSAQSMQFSAVPPAAPTRQWHARTASFLAGTPPHLPVGKYAFLKDLMFIALLVGLVIIGLYSLYIKNATFGASRLFDYFGIAVWGLSADVAQRTLQGLQLPK
jgi:hypothetical protein